MKNIIPIFLGAGIGGVLRFWFGQIALKLFGANLPYGTLGVNIIGSLLIGIFAGILAKHQQHQQFIQYFVIIGILGGFTTFSSFSLDTLRLIENGRLGAAIFYIGASLIASLLSVFVGMVISRQFV